MASVVIHEFEVEAQREIPPPSAASAAPLLQAPQPGVQEIRRILRREIERSTRVWAH